MASDWRERHDRGRNVGKRTFYADFCWPELRLIVEADSWQWHGGRQARERDVDRVPLGCPQVETWGEAASPPIKEEPGDAASWP